MVQDNGIFKRNYSDSRCWMTDFKHRCCLQQAKASSHTDTNTCSQASQMASKKAEWLLFFGRAGRFTGTTLAQFNANRTKCHHCCSSNWRSVHSLHVLTSAAVQEDKKVQMAIHLILPMEDCFKQSLPPEWHHLGQEAVTKDSVQSSAITRQ